MTTNTLSTHRLVNHWTHHPAWSAGRELLAIYATFQNYKGLTRIIRSYQEPLGAYEQLDLVPRRWLHMTIQGFAFTDEISSDAIDDLRADLRGHVPHMHLPWLRLGRPELVVDSLTIPVRPTSRISELQGVLEQSFSRSFGRPAFQLPLPPDGFNPHVTIAYANRDCDAGAIQATLDRTPSADYSFRIHNVSLVLLRRERPRWTWTRLETYALPVVTADSEP